MRFRIHAFPRSPGEGWDGGIQTVERDKMPHTNPPTGQVEDARINRKYA